MSKSALKVKIEALKGQKIEKDKELDLMNADIENLNQEIVQLRHEIATEEEQVTRKTDELMSYLQQIKGQDRTIFSLTEQLDNPTRDPRSEGLQSMLSQAAVGEAGGEADAESELVAQLAHLTARVRRLANGVADEGSAPISSSRTSSSNRPATADFSSVQVFKGPNVCVFRVPPTHTFSQLLDEAVTYWSLERSRNVLVDENEFMWPSHARVHEVLQGLPPETPPVIRLFNRHEVEQATLAWEAKAIGGGKASAGQNTGSVDVTGSEERKSNGSEDHSGDSDREDGADDDVEEKTAPSDWLPIMRQANNDTTHANDDGTEGSGDLMGALGGLVGSLDAHSLHKLKSSSPLGIRKYFDLFLYLTFAVLYMNTITLRRDILQSNFLHNTVVQEFFGEHPTLVSAEDAAPWGTAQHATDNTIAFKDISGADDFWAWVDNRLLRAVTGDPEGSVTVFHPSTNSTHFMKYNRLLGGITLRQVRVSATSCTTEPAFNHFHTGCWASLLDAKPVTSDGSFGPHAVNASVAAAVKQVTRGFQYTPAAPFLGWLQGIPRTRNGLLGVYPPGGFVVSLPSMKSQYTSIVNVLKRYNWVDRGTRGIMVSGNIYNLNLDRFAILEGMLEFSPAGSVIPHMRCRIIRVDQGWRGEDRSRLVMELGCLALVALALILMLFDISQQGLFPYDPELADEKERLKAARKQQAAASGGGLIGGLADKTKKHVGATLGSVVVPNARAAAAAKAKRKKKKSRKKQIGYFRDMWPVLEMIFYFAVFLNVGIRLLYEFEVAKLSTSFVRAGATGYVDLEGVTYLYQQTIRLDSITILLTVLRMFKFFGHNPAMSLVFRVFSRAASTFLTYLFVMFALVLFGFVMMAHLLFGPYTTHYLTPDRAFNTLLKMLVGSFDYENLAIANAYMAPLFFVLFMGIGYFVLANMFLAILNEAYSSVSQDVLANGYHWLQESEDKKILEQRRKEEEKARWTHPSDTGLGGVRSASS